MNAVVVRDETPVEAARRLEQEARALAREVADAVLADLMQVASRCTEVGTLSNLPNGIRDLLPRLGQQITDTIEQARAIDARAA